MQKKILIVLFDLETGGAERVHVNLANYWVDLGFDVEFLLLQRRGKLIEALDKRIRVTSLDVSRIRGAILPMARRLRSSGPSVILAAMWPLSSAVIIANLIAGSKGRVFVSDHTELETAFLQELRMKNLWYLKISLRLTYPLAQGVIAVSSSVMAGIVKLSGLSTTKIRVIGNPVVKGVAMAPVGAQDPTSVWGADVCCRILSVGSLKEVKDHSTLLKAFAKVAGKRKSKLIILGEGHLRRRLEAEIRELGLIGEVELPGFVMDPSPWYRTADVFVLSSKWEGFGNVLVEAMEAGLRIVCTDCIGGVNEVLAHGRYAKMVPVLDSDAMADAIIETLDKPVNREALFKRAQEFTVSAVSNQYLKYMFESDELSNRMNRPGC